MILCRFLIVSVAVGLAWFGIAWWTTQTFWPSFDPKTLVVGYGAAFLITTAGWCLTTLGLGRDARQFAGFFVGGVLVKLLLFGVVVLVVRGADLAPLRPFTMVLAPSFVVLFFSQLAWVVFEASRLLKSRAPHGGLPS